MNKRTFSIGFVYFLAAFSMGTFFPIIPEYLMHNIGVEASQVGHIMSFGQLLALLSVPIISILSDKFKKPKLFLLITLLFAGIFQGAIFSTFEANKIFALMIGFIFFRAAFFPLLDDITSTYATKNNIAYGKLRAMGSLGFATGPLFAFTVLNILNMSSNYIFFIGGFALFIAVFVIMFLDFPNDTGGSNKEFKISDLKIIFTNKLYILILLFIFLTMGIVYSWIDYINLYIDYYNGPTYLISIIVLVAAGTEIPIMFTIEKLTKKFGLSNMFIIVGIANFFRFGLLYLFGSIHLLIIVAMVHAISISFALPTSIKIIKKIVPPQASSTSIGMWSLSGTLSSALYLSIVPMIYDNFGMERLIFFSILIAILMIIIGVFIKQEIKKRGLN